MLRQSILYKDLRLVVFAAIALCSCVGGLDLREGEEYMGDSQKELDFIDCLNAIKK